MTYVAGIVFHGFELSQKYIKNLMSDFEEKKDKWGRPARYFGYDVVERLKEKLGDGLDVEVSSHGCDDMTTYYIKTDSEHVHVGESKEITLMECSNIQYRDLLEAQKRLGVKEEDSEIGWRLASCWD